MKFIQGWVKNTKTGQTKDIVVKSILPTKIKDLLIGAAMVSVGITYLTSKAFRHGSECYEKCELETLNSLDLQSKIIV